MGSSRVIRHQNYELLCGASAADDGGFMPAVTVTKQVWPTRPRVVAMRRGNYPTEEIALEAARAQGIEWIVNYG